MEANTTLKRLSRTYLKFLIGQLLFAGVAIFLSLGNLYLSLSTNDVFIILLPLMLLSLILLRNWFKGKATKEAKNLEGSLDEKLTHYQKTILVCSSLMEGFNIFTIICFLLDPNIYFLLFLGVGFPLFLQVKPSAAAFARAYKLTSSNE